MRVRLVLTVLALMGISFLAPAAVASGIRLNAVCDTLGASAMNDDHTAILLCAFPALNPATNCGSPSGCVWKPMSSGGACYTDYSLPESAPVGSSCSVSGFTVKCYLGDWGYCFSAAGNFYAGGLRPPGAGGSGPPGASKCAGGMVDYGTINGLAYLCCQN